MVFDWSWIRRFVWAIATAGCVSLTIQIVEHHSFDRVRLVFGSILFDNMTRELSFTLKLLILLVGGRLLLSRVSTQEECHFKKYIETELYYNDGLTSHPVFTLRGIAFLWIFCTWKRQRKLKCRVTLLWNPCGIWIILNSIFFLGRITILRKWHHQAHKYGEENKTLHVPLRKHNRS